MGKRGANKTPARRRKWLSPGLVLYGALLAMLSFSVLREARQPDTARPDAGWSDADWSDADRSDADRSDADRSDAGQRDTVQLDPRQLDVKLQAIGPSAPETKSTSLDQLRGSKERKATRQHDIPADPSDLTAPPLHAMPGPTSRPPAIVPPIRRQITAELRPVTEGQATVTTPQPPETQTHDPLVTMQARDENQVSPPSSPGETIPLPARNPTRGSRARRRHLAKLETMVPIDIPAAPVTPNATPASAPPAIPKPEPDLWQPAEIALALAQCQTILAGISAEADALPPIKRGPCGTPAPIRLRSIGANPAVKISPPATINCAYAATLHSWVQDKLQPAALELLGARVTKITTMASYACRKRYGRKQGKLSEHARANALDIGGFTLAGGKQIDVLSTWGPTEADIARAKTLAREKALAAKLQAAAEASAKARSDAKKQAPGDAGGATAMPLNAVAGRTMPGRENDQSSDRRRSIAASPNPGGQGQGSKTRIKPPKLRGRVVHKHDRDAPAEARFLHRVHAKACGVFGTVLGPEANEAHRNHFHFDLIKRRHRAYCE